MTSKHKIVKYSYLTFEVLSYVKKQLYNFIKSFFVTSPSDIQLTGIFDYFKKVRRASSAPKELAATATPSDYNLIIFFTYFISFDNYYSYIYTSSSVVYLYIPLPAKAYSKLLHTSLTPIDPIILLCYI